MKGKLSYTLLYFIVLKSSIAIEDLKKINGIYLIAEIIGNYDILALLAVKDFASVMEVMDRIRKLPSVEKVDISFVKDTTYPMSRWINKQILHKTSFP